MANEMPQAVRCLKTRVESLASVAQRFAGPAVVAAMTDVALVAVLALAARPRLSDANVAKLYAPFVVLVPLGEVASSRARSSAACGTRAAAGGRSSGKSGRRRAGRIMHTRASPSDVRLGVFRHQPLPISRMASLPGRATNWILLAAASWTCLASRSTAQSLRGSGASIERMHREARAERLHFYETPAGVRTAARRGVLVRLVPSASVALHRVGYPYVRPAVRTFVRRLGTQYRAACGEQLVVTSATRPARRQPANGSKRSVHPAGMAVDLRKPTKASCLRWLRTTLLDLERAGLLEVTEEFGPPHFHVAVYPTPYAQYVAARTAQTSTAVASREVYRVRGGDTLWDIAREHDTTVEQIAAANDLPAAAPIVPGQQLVIPDGEADAAAR